MEMYYLKAIKLGDDESLINMGIYYRDVIKDDDIALYYFQKAWNLYKNNPNFVIPNYRLNEIKVLIEKGLEDFSVSRLVSKMPWGVQVPGDSEHVMYVWFDAPIGYISATKQWAIDNKKEWEPYWYDRETKLVHFVGKDNIVFHCIIFPVMLKLHGNILPDNVPANEFLNL